MIKQIFISILTTCIAVTTFAQDVKDQYVDFQIVAQDDISKHIYRAPVMIPVEGFYNSMLRTVHLSFEYDLGFITVSVENLLTGEFSIATVSSAMGVYDINIGSDSGIYRIIISTSSGQQYISELLV